MKAETKAKLLGAYIEALWPHSTNITAVQVGDGAYVVGEGNLPAFIACLTSQIQFVKERTGISDEVMFHILLDAYFNGKDDE